MKRTLISAVVLVGASVAFGQSKMEKMHMHMHMPMKMGMSMNKYGGPIYSGPPALGVTASLVKAGGGAKNFSIVTAFKSMVGPKMASAELTKLTKQYGKTRAMRFITVFDFAVNDSLKIATAAGVKLPMATMGGKELAGGLVKAGLDSKGTFWTGYLLDKAVSHKIHMKVMDDIEAKWGEDADKDYHRISNQAHYDLAKAFMMKNVKLAPLH